MKTILNFILCLLISLTSFSQTDNDSIIVLNFYPEDYVEYKPLFNKIKNGQEFTINIESSGCFHHSIKRLTIKKSENKYYIEYNSKIKQLTEKQIISIKKFENELKKPLTLGCTTTDTYTITYLKQTQKVTDSSCSWHGFYNLMEELSLNKM